MKVNRQTVIEAARDLVDNEGIDKLSLQALAERLDVKPPSLYNHISSLAELRELIALDILETFETVLRDAAVGRSKDEALLAIAQAYRSFAKAHPGLYKAMLSLSSSEDSAREEGRSLLKTLYQVLEPYGLGEKGTMHFARAFRSILHGFVSLEELGFKASPDAGESFERIVGALIASLGSYDWERS
jgi:AcrR family transcriptional regulator